MHETFQSFYYLVTVKISWIQYHSVTYFSQSGQLHPMWILNASLLMIVYIIFLLKMISLPSEMIPLLLTEFFNTKINQRQTEWQESEERSPASLPP